MSDTALLRRRLLRALDLTPLALIGATSVSCMAAENAREIAEQRQLEAAKQREQAAREAEQAMLAARDAAKAEADAELEAMRAAKEAEAEMAKKAAELAAELAAEQAELVEPLPHFSCPSGEWCGSKTIAKRYAGEKTSEHPDALGCPGNLQPRADGKVDARTDPPVGMGYAYLDGAATRAGREQGQANLCCYDWGSFCGGGRPLLEEGRPMLASLERIESPPANDSRLDPRIARGWLDDARMEHASIASFLRAEAELAALAAPAGLREACLRAADDERRHARECFAIAAEYGEAWQPGELPKASLRRPALEQLAVDTLIEGGIGETIAALMARRAARGVEHRELAAVLERIAIDELEHAALAWQTIAWALRQGGESVRMALLSAAARARPHELELPAADANADQLASHGRLDARAKAQAIRDAWCELIDPMLAALAQRSCLS